MTDPSWEDVRCGACGAAVAKVFALVRLKCVKCGCTTDFQPSHPLISENVNDNPDAPGSWCIGWSKL
jgi:hypothetical protein